MCAVRANVPFLLLACLAPEAARASHRLGSRVDVVPAVVVGPDSGNPPTDGANAWEFTLEDVDARFLILRMLSGIDDGDEATVELGYGTDTFVAGPEPVLYSRPVGGTSATVRYVDANDNGVGGVTLIEYGRGEEVDIFGTSNDPCVFEEPEVVTRYGVCPLQSDPAIPSWVDVACDSVNDLTKEVARSVGLFTFLTDTKVSSCTATLVDGNVLLTSGHCIGHAQEEVDVDGYRTVEVNSASFTLDFEADCGGGCPGGYDPQFFKVEDVVRSKWVQGVSGIDYAFLTVSPDIIADLNVAPIEMMEDTSGLSVGDPVFLVHHPTGRAKKVSNGDTDPGSCEILGFTFPDGIKVRAGGVRGSVALVFCSFLCLTSGDAPFPAHHRRVRH